MTPSPRSKPTAPGAAPLSFPNDATLHPDDIALLAALRDGYVARSEGGFHGPLDAGWTNARELALYDATFGARIGWKWTAVLKEIAGRAIQPPRGTILDWGCGTGIASRAWLEQFGVDGMRVVLVDTSSTARAFAAAKLRERWPGIEVVEQSSAPRETVDVLLASHVISELEDEAFDGLVDIAALARFVAWVEPGSKQISRRLIEAREKLRGGLTVLAPCTHAEVCALASVDRSRDWCHHLATPPPEAFTTRLWNQVARELHIDLRSLPYSFLVLGRGPKRVEAPDAARVLGRPRVEKGRALLDVCRADGVSVLRFLERMDKEAFRSFSTWPARPRLHRVRDTDARIESFEPLEAPSTWNADAS